MKKNTVIINKMLNIMGGFFIICSLILYGFIHGNHERYMKIINGAYPLNQLGGGPFQMVIFLCCIAIGLALFTAANLIRRKARV